MGEESALSYAAIRRVIGLTGFALPFVLGLAAAVDGHIKDSMSAYYYSDMGDYFTGTLCVIGVFLFCYEFRAPHVLGWLAKIGGLGATGVALSLSLLVKGQFAQGVRTLVRRTPQPSGA